MNRGRTLLRAGLAVGLAWLLLIGAISLALAVPGHEILSGFGGEGRLDYSAYRSGLFAPLTRGFIARILGLDLENTPPGQTGGLEDGGALAAGSIRTVFEHPFTNDDFGDALSIPGIPFTAKTNTSTATRQPGEPESCTPVGGTVWYRYSPGSDIALVANTIGTNYSAAVAVFTGSDLPGLKSIRCDSHVSGNAQVVFPARAGTTYYFQITGLLGGGDLVFNLDTLGVTSRASISSSGAGANGPSRVSTISGDGRYVAFGSWADNLVPGDTNRSAIFGGRIHDVFVHDRATRATTRVSVSSSGEQANDHSWLGTVSANGRHVAFVSYASNLVPGDTNGQPDVFVHDRVTQTTTRVSVASNGRQASGDPVFHEYDCGYSYPQETSGGNRPCLEWLHLDLSRDGRYVAFDSWLRDLVPGDTNGWRDVFVHDRATGRTSRASVSSAGNQGDGFSGGSRISEDGRHVIFNSVASNLVARDRNEVGDVFAHDLHTGRTSLVSVASSGKQGNDASLRPSTTADGRFVAFASSADNLVNDDTNEVQDVFVHDRETGTTTRVSVGANGEQQVYPGVLLGTDAEFTSTTLYSDISGDGRRVTFHTNAPNLVPDDDNGLIDVFVHDRVAGTTTRISVSSAGEEANGSSLIPRISSNGLSVAFSSYATNLVSGDTNDDEDIYVHGFSVLR